MVEIILDILGTLGGVVVVVGALTGWLGKVWASRILQNELNRHNVEIARLEADLQKEIEKARMKDDIEKQATIRYQEYQFKLYNELWHELYALQESAEKLWRKASMANMLNFRMQLEITKSSLNKNILLVETEDIRSLSELFDRFERFRVGKKKLIEIQSRSEVREADIEQLTSNNRIYKEQYSALISDLRIQFRNSLLPRSSEL